MQAFSGIMSITGEPGGAPVRSACRSSISPPASSAPRRLTAAVHQRERTGRGQRVDGSLLDTVVGLLDYHAEGYLLSGVLRRRSVRAPSLSPYRNFRCRDGQWVFIAAANDRFWQSLAGALGLDGPGRRPRFLKNPDRVRHRSELEASWRSDRELRQEPLLKRLEAADVPPPGQYRRPGDERPADDARGMIERVHHPKLGEIPWSARR